MPKIFLYASAFLLVLSAGLSFLNKGKLAARNAEIAQTQAAAAAAQSDATKAHAAQKTAEKNAAEAVTKAGDLQTQLTAKASESTDLSAKVDAATKSITDKEAQIADLQKQVAALPKSATGQPVGESEQKIADLQHQVEEFKVIKDGLDGQVKAAQSQTASLSREIAARHNNVSMNGLHGQVLAVDHNWNFVVLNLGDRQGVNNGAPMIRRAWRQHGGTAKNYVG